MNFKYKSVNIDFLNGIKIANICATDDFYYFESDEVIEDATQISDEEFDNVASKIIYLESEPIEPQPTQLDRIEAAVTKSHEEIANVAIDEYTLTLMEEGVI